MKKTTGSIKGFEVIGETVKGIDIEDRRAILRASHNALIDTLSWKKAPLFLLVNNRPVGIDMFWISSLLESEVCKIIPMLRGNELDVRLSKFDKRVLHVGPVFVSLYWATSNFNELRKEKMTADFPLFGTTVRYKPEVSKEEVMSAYKTVRSFIEQTLKKKGFNGACFWGFVDQDVISPNMFYFARTRKIVHGQNIYDGEQLDHSFYFELGDELESQTKPKYISFFVSSKGQVRYNLRKMKLRFDVFGKDMNVVESVEIPFCDFLLSIRPNAFHIRPNCFEGATT